MKDIQFFVDFTCKNVLASGYSKRWEFVYCDCVYGITGLFNAGM